MTDRRWKRRLAGAAAGLLLAAVAAGRAPALAAKTVPEAALKAVSEAPASGQWAAAPAEVPLRATFERMGWTVTWDAASRSAALSRSGRVWIAAEGRADLTGPTTVRGSAPARIADGVFRIPARTAARLLESARRLEAADAPSVKRGTSAAQPDEAAGHTAAYTDDELFWLARIIEAEAGGEPMEGKVAVGCTVLNRVASEEYPDTIWGVIFDRKWGTQYTPVSNGTIRNTPSADSYEAARRCLAGENPVADCMFFLNPDIAVSRWIEENREYYTTIGSHDFYR